MILGYDRRRLEIILNQIGIIHSPYKKRSDAPRQGRLKDNVFKIEVFKEYEQGLKDVETATHLIVLYWCDKADRSVLQTNTPFDTTPHGVFATRSPQRPNPIAFNIADVIERRGNILVVKGMDALDGSPLLDIKPYSSEVDCILDAKLGWRMREDK